MYFGNAQYGGALLPSSTGTFASMWGDGMRRFADFASSGVGMVVVHLAMVAVFIAVIVFFITLTKTEGMTGLGGMRAYNNSLGNAGTRLQESDSAFGFAHNTAESRPGASIRPMLNRVRKPAVYASAKKEAMTNSEDKLRARLGN